MTINLGNIVSIGGKSVGSGISSGLDTESIINSLVEARSASITNIEESLEANESKVSAFNDLRSILETLKSSADFLRNPPGINSAQNNIFEFRTAALTSSTIATPSSVLSVNAAAGGVTGTFDISIGNLAKAKETLSESFASKTLSATNVGQFSAGTFQFTGTANTLIGDTLSSSDYAVANAGKGILTAEGIHNVTVSSGAGNTNLQGTISGFTATAKATDLVDISVVVGGDTFTATDVDASTSGTDIASGTTITFSNGTTSFDIELGSNVTIDQGSGSEAANLTAFEAALDTAMEDQVVLQGRQLGNFDEGLTGNTILNGLRWQDTRLFGDNFQSDGTHGSFGEFSVTAATSPGADDGIISVVIDGETFQATNLGNAIITTLDSDDLSAALHSVSGSGTGILSAAGIHNIQNTGGPADANLYGTISGFTATIDGTNVDLSITINGSTYTADDVPANTGGGSDSIAAGIITFTDAVTGTTFDLNLSAEYQINGSQTLANIFASELDDALALQTVTAPSSEYSVQGSVVGGLLTSDGIHSFSTNGSAGNTGLQGTLSGFSATYNPGDTVDVSVTVNGTVYTASGVDASTGGGGNEIAAGTTLTFSNGNTSFRVTLASATVIGDQAGADTFATNLDTALASQSIYQSRQLENYDPGLTTGLTNTHVRLVSNNWDTTDGTQGALSGFTVTPVSAPDASDATITVTIDGEVYTASGLGGVGDNDTVATNFVLTAASGNRLELNIGDAGVSMDFSDADAAQTVETALDTFFRVDRHTENITLQSTTSDKYLELNIADAGISMNFTADNNSNGVAYTTILQNALNKVYQTSVSNVTVEEGDSLSDIAAAINATTIQSGISANIVQVSDTDFRLAIQNEREGIANTYTIVDSGGVLTDVTFTTIQEAEDAVASINGIEVTRSSNAVDDVISGLTFNLVAETANYGTGSAESVLVTVDNDRETAEAAILNFINAYNEFRVFAAEQTSRDEDTGQLAEDAALGTDTTLSTLIRQISSEITKVVGGVSDENFSRLSDIGITLTDFEGDDETVATTNILTYDPTTLANALDTDFDALRQIFEFNFSASTSEVSVFKRANTVTLSDFKVTVDISQPSGQQVSILDSNDVFLYYADLTVSGGGYKITGSDDTTIEGLELIYTGNGDETFTVSLSSGITERIFNVVDDALEADGTIDNAVETLDTEETRLEKELERAQARIDLYRDTLLLQYSALEAAITRVNTLLDFLDQQAQSIFNNN